MPHVPIPAISRQNQADLAERRWRDLLTVRPDLGPALDLQRRLLMLVGDLASTLEPGRLPRLSLPQKYLAAKLARGVPALAGEPIPLPVPLLRPALAQLCEALAEGGAGEAATHIRDAIFVPAPRIAAWRRISSGSSLSSPSAHSSMRCSGRSSATPATSCSRRWTAGTAAAAPPAVRGLRWRRSSAVTARYAARSVRAPGN